MLHFSQSSEKESLPILSGERGEVFLGSKEMTFYTFFGWNLTSKMYLFKVLLQFLMACSCTYHWKLSKVFFN